MSKLPEPVRPGFTVEKPLLKASKAQSDELQIMAILGENEGVSSQ